MKERTAVQAEFLGVGFWRVFQEGGPGGAGRAPAPPLGYT